MLVEAPLDAWTTHSLELTDTWDIIDAFSNAFAARLRIFLPRQERQAGQALRP